MRARRDPCISARKALTDLEWLRGLRARQVRARGGGAGQRAGRRLSHQARSHIRHRLLRPLRRGRKRDEFDRLARQTLAALELRKDADAER